MTYLIFFCVTLLVSAALTPVVKIIAVKTGYVVQPRQDRWHKKPTPLLGGIAIFLSFSASYLLAFGFDRKTMPVLIGGFLIFLLGLVDDLKRLNPQVKLIGQITVAAVLISLDVVVKIIPYPVIAIPVTFLWIVGLTNSFNLLDNMDGLSAGTAAICALALFAFSLSSGDRSVALCSILLAGACAGFLFYNFNPASIFMGDCGSMFLGCTLAAIAIIGTVQHVSGLFVAVLIPLFILGIPIFDTVFVTFFRKVRGQPISQGGRDHVSHRLVNMGLSERNAVLVLYVISALFGAGALFYNQISPFVIVICLILVILGLFYFGVFLGQSDWRVAQKAISELRQRRLAGPLMPTLQKFIELFIDLILIVIAYFAAYLIRYEGTMTRSHMSQFVGTLPIVIVVKIVVFAYFGLYQTIWRHVGIRDFINILKGVAASTLIIVTTILMYARFTYFSRALFVVDALLTLFFISGARFSLRIFREYLESLPAKNRKVLIAGAGDGGELVLREIRNNPAFKYHVVGFIDDDPFKRHRRIHGVSVLGSIAEIDAISKKTGAEEVIIAIRSASEETVKRIVEMCERSALKWETFFSAEKLLQ
jgi:UDP-GlcNAc:undecaprenyl-phosphate GlcNAc-1-phosphate transferase